MVTQSRSQIFDKVTIPLLQNHFEKNDPLPPQAKKKAFNAFFGKNALFSHALLYKEWVIIKGKQT